MIKSLLISALIAVAAVSVQAKAVAYADMQTPGDKIVLHDDKRHCAEGFLFAAITWQGRPLKACWRVLNTPGGPGVHIIDEEGDEGLIPAQVFQPVKEL
jgi:hypothetical protein